MYCKKCGKELADDARFCPSCGEEQTPTTFEDPFTATVIPEVEEKKPLRVWSIFARVGKILGIVAAATSVIPFLIGLQVGIFGIVFSCLGRKALTEEAYRSCKLGLILSIVGTVVSLISYVILIVSLGSAT